MAIVKVFQNSNGGTVMIDDACCRNLSPEELERRRLAISRAILDIDRKVQLARLQTQNTPQTSAGE